jgi:hypothetical protein
MLATYALTISAIFVLLVGWILVQQVARLFARRHPEFGPYQERRGCGGGGCGSCGGEGEGSCERH